MRTSWNGTLSFGLVNVPVGLAPAVRPNDVSFRTLVRETMSPVKQKRWSEELDREIGAEECVRGYEFLKGQFVVVEDAELDAAASQRSRSIELTKFVPLDQVDPVFFEKAYYVTPGDDGPALKAYALLVRALETTERAGVAKTVLWGKERVVLVRAHEGALVAELLFFADDVCSSETIAQAAAGVPVDEGMLPLAEQMIVALGGDFDPAEYANEHRRAVREMIDRKVAGEEIVVAEEAPAAPMPDVDLVEALKASIAAAKTTGEKPAPAKRRKKAAA